MKFIPGSSFINNTPKIKPVTRVSTICVSIWVKIKWIITAKTAQNNIPGEFETKKSRSM